MTYTIYSKHGCPFCEQIKLLFELNEFRFVEYRLGRDFTGSEFYDQFGVGSTFPQILMGEKALGGCTETIKYLQEQNICCNV
ncbi:glutaredoxin [Synechococcus phage S-CAM1]|jgi:glutaredoxin|uniref:Glutaredoxin n=1 Tax=Synechococcus phage S-CAM1 TaxID=754037 RepID=M4QEZ9_9CAUD|nr:glutaredoxin [Synechococcus phage S-CAM1]AGH26859.1 glutaredoxin [Synechococcus phage S-CAM1]AOV57470.1 glutaredoxin [Synechococcus phage S-CAM1]AOV57720.1 glutaredoxin [Synechococcus phage S-CAM1]AOV57970.1 glutaredoxin [Synechococcus phage S-CAM1]AOV58220.1 glutaredoxin [Synechococcus phage S-CAM1]|tara:strand:- start:478 stop:723 length:246 start_codon:yes stop_codon:yes gene_type:complete